MKHTKFLSSRSLLRWRSLPAALTIPLQFYYPEKTGGGNTGGGSTGGNTGGESTDKNNTNKNVATANMPQVVVKTPSAVWSSQSSRTMGTSYAIVHMDIQQVCWTILQNGMITWRARDGAAYTFHTGNNKNIVGKTRERLSMGYGFKNSGNYRFTEDPYTAMEDLIMDICPSGDRRLNRQERNRLSSDQHATTICQFNQRGTWIKWRRLRKKPSYKIDKDTLFIVVKGGKTVPGKRSENNINGRQTVYRERNNRLHPNTKVFLL